MGSTVQVHPRRRRTRAPGRQPEVLGHRRSCHAFAEGNQISIGKWCCNLAKKTFVLALASDAGLFEISGVLEKAQDQKWRAKITKKRQT